MASNCPLQGHHYSIVSHTDSDKNLRDGGDTDWEIIQKNKKCNWDMKLRIVVRCRERH